MKINGVDIASIYRINGIEKTSITKMSGVTIYTPPSIPPGTVLTDLIMYVDAGVSTSYPGSGTDLTDITYNGNNGVLTNGTTYNSTDGGQFILDGINDYINFGNVLAFNFTAPFSIGCWFKASPTQPSPDSSIMGNISRANIYTGYMLWYNGGTIDFYFNNGRRANSLTVLTPNTWYNVIAVWTGTQAILYLNGTLNVSAAYSTPPANGSPSFSMGTYQPDRNFKGSIGSGMVYNRALSSVEVLQNFNASKTRFGY